MTSSSPSRPGSRGRPSREEATLLRERILKTALAEFLRSGYAGSTIESIARASGVSRTTVYALYGDKASLFNAMLRASIRGPDLFRHVAFDDRPPEIVLREAMNRLNFAYHREPNLQIFRLCIGEADRFPELIESMRSLMSCGLDALVAYLCRLRDEGRLLVDDCEAAARLFNLLALGTMKSLMMPHGSLTDYDREGHLNIALDIFARGVLVDQPLPASPADSPLVPD